METREKRQIQRKRKASLYTGCEANNVDFIEVGVTTTSADGDNTVYHLSGDERVNRKAHPGDVYVYKLIRTPEPIAFKCIGGMEKNDDGDIVIESEWVQIKNFDRRNLIRRRRPTMISFPLYIFTTVILLGLLLLTSVTMGVYRSKYRETLYAVQEQSRQIELVNKSNDIIQEAKDREAVLMSTLNEVNSTINQIQTNLNSIKAVATVTSNLIGSSSKKAVVKERFGSLGEMSLEDGQIVIDVFKENFPDVDVSVLSDLYKETLDESVSLITLKKSYNDLVDAYNGYVSINEEELSFSNYKPYEFSRME